MVTLPMTSRDPMTSFSDDVVTFKNASSPRVLVGRLDDLLT